MDVSSQASGGMNPEADDHTGPRFGTTITTITKATTEKMMFANDFL